MRVSWLAMLALIAIGALFAVAGCGSGDSTVTETVTVGEAEVGSSEESSSGEEESAEVESDDESAPPKQTFTGTGQKNLGTITVPKYATVSWECASCGNTNFIIENSASDPNIFPTNGLEQTEGVEPLPPGTYHTVVVETTAGPWTVTIEGE